jgi:pilus assembly protein Flp/PilA
MRTLQVISQRLRLHEDGQDLIEYALLVGLIAVVAVAGVTSVGKAVMDSFWSVIASGLAVS